MKEVREEIENAGLRVEEFSWQKVRSSDHTRPDVEVSLIKHRSGYFKFNSTRKGELSFTRSPGINGKVEEGSSADWANELLEVRIWLDVLMKEIEAADEGRTASSYDSGLPRQEIFLEDLVARVARSEETGELLALVMMDLDKFKPINDTHGHPAGNDVLQSVVDVLKEVTRDKASCYRYGGDEFSILLPNYSEDEAVALAERLRKKIESLTVGRKKLRITASFGVAVIPTHATGAEELVEKTDAAMYDAKRYRGNLVRISGEPEPQSEGPRLAPRRSAKVKQFSDVEIDQIRRSWFAGHYAHCPRDRSLLRVRELEFDEKTTPGLDISCPYCGLSERVMPLS